MSKKRLNPPSPSSLLPSLTFFLFPILRAPNSTEIQSLATDFAILDIQWTPHSELVGGDLLAVATSTGILAFYRLQQQQEQQQQKQQQQQPPKLVLSHVQHITDDDTTLVLSLTWHPVRPGVLGLTLSDGRVCVCTSMGTGSGSGSGSGSTEEEDGTAAGLWSQDAAVSLQDVHEHELEAWMMTFTPESWNVLSGGDDMVLQCSHVADDDGGDDESEEEAEQEEDEVEDEQHALQKKPNRKKNKTNLLWQNRKLHHAGITAILPLSETLIITGSYDDHIRLLQLPKIPGGTRPQLLAELNLGGGVWRLKLLTARGASSQWDEDDSSAAAAAENKSPSGSTVSALRSSCSSSSRNRITRYALPILLLLLLFVVPHPHPHPQSTSSFLSNFKNKNLFFAPVSFIRACVSQSVSQPACLDCCRDATRFFYVLY